MSPFESNFSVKIFEKNLSVNDGKPFTSLFFKTT